LLLLLTESCLTRREAGTITRTFGRDPRAFQLDPIDPKGPRRRARAHALYWIPTRPSKTTFHIKEMQHTYSSHRRASRSGALVRTRGPNDSSSGPVWPTTADAPHIHMGPSLGHPRDTSSSFPRPDLSSPNPEAVNPQGLQPRTPSPTRLCTLCPPWLRSFLGATGGVPVRVVLDTAAQRGRCKSRII
jgi:hypothetical protein